MKAFPFASAATLALALAATTPAGSVTYNFVTLEPPGATANDFLAVFGVNDNHQALVGGILGSATVINDLYNLTTHTYTPLPAYPGSTANSTSAQGINDAGVITGVYSSPKIASGGFILSGGSFTPVTYPGAASMLAVGINNNGDLSGTWSDGASNHGFVRIGNTFTDLDVPVSWGADTFAFFMNTAGTVVGQYSSSPGLVFNSEPFVWSKGVYSKGTLPTGYAYGSYSDNNDEGSIIGYATNDPINGTNAISFVDQGGVRSLISDPLGVGGTYAFTINDAGVIGGTYVDANGDFQAFLGFPVPEPATFVLFGVGMIGVRLMRRRFVHNDRTPHG